MVKRGYKPDFCLMPKPTSLTCTSDPSIIVASAGSLFLLSFFSSISLGSLNYCSLSLFNQSSTKLGALNFKVSLEGKQARAGIRLLGESALDHFLFLHNKLRGKKNSIFWIIIRMEISLLYLMFLL